MDNHLNAKNAKLKIKLCEQQLLNRSFKINIEFKPIKYCLYHQSEQTKSRFKCKRKAYVSELSFSFGKMIHGLKVLASSNSRVA